MQPSRWDSMRGDHLQRREGRGEMNWSWVLRILVAAAAILVMTVTGLGRPQMTLEVWTIALQPFFTDYMHDLIGRYQRANPSIQVKWVDVQFQAIEQKLLAAIAGGVAPDVVNLNVEFTARIAEKGALLDMDRAVPAAERTKYFAGLWASNQFRGRSYGIPWYVAPPVLIFNTALFKKAGLDPRHPPATEDAMISAAKQIKNRAHVYGFMPSVDGVRLMHGFLESGLPVLSADRKRAVFNSPAHVAYLRKYVDLFKQDYFPDDTLRRGFAGAVERYSAGQLGMVLIGPQFLLRIKESNPDVYGMTDVGRYPIGKAKVIHAALMTVAVPKASKHPQEAVEFALYMTSDENQLAFSQRSVVFPSVLRAASNPYFRRHGPDPEWQARAIAVDELKFGRDLTLTLPNQGELYKIFREAVESAFFGKMSPKEALDWAVREWNARL